MGDVSRVRRPSATSVSACANQNPDPAKGVSVSVERIDISSMPPPADIGDRDYSLPPHSLQAEEAVLGSIFKSPDVVFKVSDFLKSSDFYSSKNRSVFRAMLDLFSAGVPIDYQSVADKLRQLGLYESSGGMAYLSELNTAMPTSAHIEHYGRAVERSSVMRQLISNAQSISELAYRDNLSIEVALERAERLILGISEKRVVGDFKTLETVLTEYMERIEVRGEGDVSQYGIGTTFLDLDRLLGGFQRTDLVILAARTSVGKTSFATGLAVNAASKLGAKVAIFSLEMASEQLAARLMAMESGVDSVRIRSGYMNELESRKLDQALNYLAQAPIWVDDTPGLSIMELRSKARRLASESGLDMVIVDYLQLVSTDHQESRVQEIAYITRSLKQLARELNLPVVALSQLSRAVEQRTPHIPMLSDLRESGSIEQDADVVIFLYREDKYLPDTDKKGVVDVIVAKNRNGPTGQVQMLFLDRTTKFLDLEVFRV